MDSSNAVKHRNLPARLPLQPVDIIGVDAAILFSDILVVPQAMGLEVQLIESQESILPNPIKSIADMSRVRVLNVHETLQYVFDAIKMIKKELNGRVPLIGFAGAPWTLLCYMVQGKEAKHLMKQNLFLLDHPRMPTARQFAARVVLVQEVRIAIEHANRIEKFATTRSAPAKSANKQQAHHHAASNTNSDRRQTV